MLIYRIAQEGTHVGFLCGSCHIGVKSPVNDGHREVVLEQASHLFFERTTKSVQEDMAECHPLGQTLPEAHREEVTALCSHYGIDMEYIMTIPAPVGQLPFHCPGDGIRQDSRGGGGRGRNVPGLQVGEGGHPRSGGRILLRRPGCGYGRRPR